LKGAARGRYPDSGQNCSRLTTATAPGTAGRFGCDTQLSLDLHMPHPAAGRVQHRDPAAEPSAEPLPQTGVGVPLVDAVAGWPAARVAVDDRDVRPQPDP